MDKLPSESMGSELANCQPVSIDKSNQNMEYVEEIGLSTSKNGVNSQSTSEDNTIDWQNFLYSKFESRSIEQQENEIEEVVSKQDGEKNNTVSVQQPVLERNKGNNKRERKQEKTISDKPKPAIKRIQNIHGCKQCDKKFASKQRLAIHRAKLHGVIDPDTSLTSCEICGRVFGSKEALAHHRSQHNTEKFKFHCSYCSRSFTRKIVLDNHEQTHTKNYRYKCRFCSKGSTSEKVILFHEAQEHNNVSVGAISHSCSVCGKSFPSSSELERHESIHRKDLTIQCEQCDKMFKTVHGMHSHLRNHCQNKPKQCESKKSKNQEPDDRKKIEKPQMEPLQEKGYLAEKTDEVITNDAFLESIVTEEIHIKDELTESDASDNDSTDRDIVGDDIDDQDCRNDVAMDVENQMTVSPNPEEGPSKSQSEKAPDDRKSALKKQIKNRCDICGKTFFYWPRLMFHRVKVHGIEDKDSPISRCICEICGKVHFNQDDLERHLSTHKNTKEGDFTYHCTYCTRSFVNKHQQIAHEQSHTKNYRYKCQFCGKGSPNRKVILLHEAQKHNHVSENSTFYRCSVCSKDFPRPSLLKTHELSHRTEYTIKCENCDKMFKSDRRMKLHLSTCRLATPSNRTRTRSKKRRTTGSRKPQTELLRHQVDSPQQIILPKPPSSEIELEPNPEDKHSCVDCDKTFNSQSGLTHHRAKIHGIEEIDVSNQELSSADGEKRKERKKYSCDVCDQIFVHRERLYKHRVKVHDISDNDVYFSRYKCEICGKVHFSEDALKYHRSTHKKTDEDKFNHHCSYCDRKFISEYHRKCHEQTHTKDYEFKCRFCDTGSPYKRKILLHEAQKHDVVSKEGKKGPSSSRNPRIEA